MISNGDGDRGREAVVIWSFIYFAMLVILKVAVSPNAER